MKILVVNGGSSSLKYRLFAGDDIRVVATGLIEKIGEATSLAQLEINGTHGVEQIKQEVAVADHGRAIASMLTMLQANGVLEDVSLLGGIGHRVVHGGEAFHQPVFINEQVIAGIEALIPLAPLHNPVNLMGIKALVELAPAVPQVAVFDTAFHQSIPRHRYLYGLPGRLYEEYHVRRYGFHGTSHSYVSGQAAACLGRPVEELRLITLHLGNGASAAAIEAGRCVETSMGMTPLEGLIMGTRCGDIDPAIVFYLARQTGMTMDELDDLLNRQSGLKGICGHNDMRTITMLADRGDASAGLALDMFCHRLKKYIGSYLAILGKTDALVFTGGIGENSALVRQQSCQGLEALGIEVDPAKNTGRAEKGREIQTEQSRVKVLVIPTDEELAIALQTRQCISDGSKS